MSVIDMKFNDLVIKNVPLTEKETSPFVVELNLAIIRSEMTRLGIKTCDYNEFCKIYK